MNKFVKWGLAALGAYVVFVILSWVLFGLVLAMGAST